MLAESILVHPALSYPILDRVTAPLDPQQGDANYGALSHAYWMMGYGSEWRDANDVNEQTALKYSVVWACVRYISQTVASLGWHIFERNVVASKARRDQIPLEDDIAWLLDMQANPETSSLDFRQVMLKDALTWGNGYAEIERDAFGKPRWLWQLDAAKVTLERTDSGRLVYKFDNGNQRDPTYLPPENVFHLRGLGGDGLSGWSVIKMARRTMQFGVDQERFGQKFFSGGPTPGGILSMPGNVKKEERHEVRDSFERTYGGARNAGRVVVLSGGMEFKPLTISHSDAQFIESRRFTCEDVCRFYGVPPHKIADLTRATNNNIESQAIEAVQDCLLPWCRRLESEADVKLFGRTQRGRRYTRLNLAAMLRGDSATQTDTVVKKVNAAIMTPNEGREYFDLNPVKGGDELIVQGAMVSLKHALADPGPLPTKLPPPEQEPPNQNQDKPAQKNLAILGPLVAAYARVLRVEADKAKRAHKQGRLREHAESFYGPDNIACLKAAIRPLHEEYLASIGLHNGQVERLVSERAVACNNAGRLALASGKLDLVEDWVGRAAQAAADDFAALAPRSQEPGVRSQESAALAVVTAPPAAPVYRFTPVVNISMPQPVIELHQAGDNVTFAPTPTPEVKVDNHITTPDVRIDNHVTIPEQPPATVQVDNVVNVPEQPAAVIQVPRQRSPKVVVNVPEPPAMQPVFQVPEQPPAVVQTTVNVPESPAPVINLPEQPAPIVQNVVNVPEQPAPVVKVPRQRTPRVNVQVPEQQAPVVNVSTPEVTVNVPEQPPPVVQPADMHVHFPPAKPRKARRQPDGSWQITEEAPDGDV